MKNAPHSSVPYRAEVDGLRAIAVLPVILYHAGISLFGGGFVGVDVFFVISGYLITSILLSEHERGSFSVLRFYERRARRILPPLFVMMAVCLPLAWLWLDPIALRSFAKSLVTVPLFSSNALFWMETGYFGGDVELKPLIHTWTLAVEEQYYLIFPLLLWLGWRMPRRLLVAGLALLGLASLTWAEYGAQQASTAAFYLLPARGWELLLGSLLALALQRRPQPAHGAMAEVGGLLGLGLIGYAVFAFGVGTPFPGLHALFPTLGAALVIASCSPRTFAGRLLASRPLVDIGLISYSAYLWHQPLFAFARNADLMPPSTAALLGLAALSLVLAWLSWRFIEGPFRDKQRISRRQIFSASALASVAFMAIGLLGYQQQGFPGRYNLDPALVNAFVDPTIRHACDQGYNGDGKSISLCYFGAASQANGASLAVFGDSHSEALLPAFAQLAEGLPHGIAHLGVGGCPPLLGVDVAAGNYAPTACEALAQRQLAFVREHKVRHVVLIARWSLYTDGGYQGARKVRYFLTDAQHSHQDQATSRQVFEAGLARTVAQYRALGAQVDVVAQAPQQLASPRNLYYRLAHQQQDSQASKLAAVQALSVPYQEHKALQAYTRGYLQQLADAGQIRLFSLDAAFCDAQRCLIGDLRPWYKDSDHLNEQGAQRSLSVVRQIVEPATVAAVQ